MVRGWLQGLETRALHDLTFQEVRRGVQALSRVYVQRRDRLDEGGALDGAAKRAAFSSFYGPLHYLMTREVIAQAGLGLGRQGCVVDLGCGTGVVGAAWALASGAKPKVEGIDRNRWAVSEVRHTFAALGVQGRARVGNIDALRAQTHAAGIVAAYTVNELSEDSRQRLLGLLLEARRGGSSVLIIEPIAKRQIPWWQSWQTAFEAEGGQHATWTAHIDRPDWVLRLDQAARLDHRVVKVRTLILDAKA